MTRKAIPTNTHIDINDEHLIKFAKSIRQDKKLISIQCKPLARELGYCYWDVELMVLNNGGTAVYGWLFTQWPGSHIEAMHHAIYRDCDGNLLDICPKMPGHNNPTITTFLEDDSISINLDKVPAIKNKFYTYDSNIFTRNFIKTYEKRNNLTVMHSKLSYELGYRCEGQRFIVRGKQPEIKPDLEIRLSSPKSVELGRRIHNESIQLGKNIDALKKHLGQ